MKIRALIIDDDPFIRDLLSDKVEQYVTDMEIIGTASSGGEGLVLIASEKPDLVFLDVEMADMTGFEMLAQIDAIPFQTIFITSFNHYAIKAIRFNALDYLLKPIDLGELRSAIERYRESANGASSNKVNQAINNMKASDPGDEVLTLQLQDQELNVQLKDIVRIEGERNYSIIFSSSGKKNLSSKNLAFFEDLLEDKGFFRCHKSHLVNASQIVEANKTGVLKMSDASEITVSRRRLDAFKEWYSKWQ